MSKPKLPEKFVRYLLGSLLLLVAINAFGGGYYGMAGAKNVPVEWLKGSPFSNYFLPGLILFAGVGGSVFFAAIAVFKRHRIAPKAAFICGTIPSSLACSTSGCNWPRLVDASRYSSCGCYHSFSNLATSKV